MNWEIVLGIITLLSAFISVMSVVVKVNGTLARLDEAVRQLRDSIEAQGITNEVFRKTLSSHETRITVLERNQKGKNTEWQYPKS